MTPIQAQSLPIVLAGKDLIAKAKTGSGKTAAFAIGLLEKLNPRFFGVQVLVLCPTRELSTQVATEFRSLARSQPNIKILTLCGGQPIGPQIGSLEHGAHIVVGTPGRIKDHLRKETLVLDGVFAVVLDEADRMLDMGFVEDMETILECTPKTRQTLLFSATYSDKIRELSRSFQHSPIEVSVDTEHAHNQIQQHFYKTTRETKATALAQLLLHYQPTSCLVFCNMKKQSQELCDELVRLGYKALALHGDLEQRDRDQVLVQFKNHSCPILIATDVAARGLDIDELSMVVNYDLPQDVEIYIHRIGRTGRAGNEGLAINLVTSSDEVKLAFISDLHENKLDVRDMSSLSTTANNPPAPIMTTLCISAGRKDKVRPGDILGALTGEAGINSDSVGKIDIFDHHAYVAIERTQSKQALGRLVNGKIKGRKFKVRSL